MTGSCPSENALVAHCAGRNPAQVGLLDHLDDCHGCQAVVAAMMQSMPAATDGPRPIRPQTLEISSTVANRYEVRELLGWGGMGEVYSAWDLHLTESVALKTLSIFKVDAPELAARLRGEAQLARKVTHPNVVRIFDFGTHCVATDESGALLPFLTMELLSGQTLGGRLRGEGPYRATEGIPIAIDILRGLGAVHAVGIVHRDLKPDNVFLTSSNGQDPTRTVLTDFGLARALGSDLFRHSQSGTIVGTFAYLSPEQLEGKVATKASDIYAFGIVLFEMLTGQLPGSNPGTHQDPREPTSTQPVLVNLPTSVRRIVSKCLDREPDRRYALTETIIED